MDYKTTLNGTVYGNSTQNGDIAYWEQIFSSVVIGLISIAGLVGNSMIIEAVSFSRKLQTSTNAFIVSLSVADLLTSFFMIWFIVGLLGRNSWPLPRANWICAITGFMLFTCTGVSIYTLAAISLNRLILIIKPLLYQKIFTTWKLGILVAIPWVISTVSFGSLLVSGTGAFGYDHTDLTCSDLDTHERAKTFNTVQTVLGLPLPLVVIVVSYLWIYIYLKNRFRTRKRNLMKLSTMSGYPTTGRPSNSANVTSANKTECSPGDAKTCTAISSHVPMDSVDISDARLIGYRSSSPADIEEDESSGCASVDKINSDTNPTRQYGSIANVNTPQMPMAISIRQRERMSRQQIEITKNLFMVVCAYFACFIPFFIFTPINNRHVLFYIRIPTLANSAINFAIYARRHPDFKTVFGHMIRGSYSKIPQPSRLLKFLLSKGIRSG